MKHGKGLLLTLSALFIITAIMIKVYDYYYFFTFPLSFLNNNVTQDVIFSLFIFSGAIGIALTTNKRITKLLSIKLSRYLVRAMRWLRPNPKVAIFFGLSLVITLLLSLLFLFGDYESMGHFALFLFNFLGAELFFLSACLGKTEFPLAINFLIYKWLVFYLLSVLASELFKRRRVE